MDLVTGQDNKDGEDIIQGKWPRKLPDKPLSVPERKETIRKDHQVPDQKNDVSRCLEWSNKAAHHKDECCIEISKDLVVERGDSVAHGVGKVA
jgi:hypothetical protein